ncbi:ArnT family glycosyltransferase [Polaribacter sp.]|uniref:ArnT family glycosyltransferase n=1 Tax=Polaribacter sp. TaxID=1920175 RepID=UPI003F69D3D8
MNISYKKLVLGLLFFSTLIRIFLATQLEFGNDEVYYWLYAKYPAISHFDHPPFVGFFIQFFTLNLYFDSELAIRLAAIIPASCNMYLLFLIGKFLKNDLVGLLSVLLYNLSIYGFVISGMFILPDAPLLFFWLLGFYFLIQSLPEQPTKHTRKLLLLGFLCIGCAIYSKYQAIYLVIGTVAYVFLFNRKWLKNIVFYLGFIFPIIAIGLIFYWNYQNDFISYTFHNDRVSLFSFSFNKDSFLREVLGQIVYNNPYIFVMIILMIIAIIKKKFLVAKMQLWMFLVFALPLIFTTIYLSISRDTLPHWSGVSYITLLPILAFFLEKRKNIAKKITVGLGVFILLLLALTFEINNGFLLPKNKETKPELIGRNDAIMDLYGWQQASEKIAKIIQEKGLEKLPIISDNWYPAAHIDYYIAQPNDMLLYGKGELPQLHKYYWVNKELPKLNHKKVFYITDSRNYKDPRELFKSDNYQDSLIITIPILRNKKTVKNIFFYQLSKN